MTDYMKATSLVPSYYLSQSAVEFPEKTNEDFGIRYNLYSYSPYFSIPLS